VGSDVSHVPESDASRCVAILLLLPHDWEWRFIPRGLSIIEKEIVRGHFILFLTPQQRCNLDDIFDLLFLILLSYYRCGI